MSTNHQIKACRVLYSQCYAQSNEYGEALAEWADENDQRFVFDAKDMGTFHSVAWHRD